MGNIVGALCFTALCAPRFSNAPQSRVAASRSRLAVFVAVTLALSSLVISSFFQPPAARLITISCTFGGILLLLLFFLLVAHFRAAQRRAVLRRTHPGFMGAPPLWAYALSEPSEERPQFTIAEHPRCCALYCYATFCYPCAAADLAAAVAGQAAWRQRCCAQLLCPGCVGDGPTMRDYVALARMHGAAVGDGDLRSFSRPCTGSEHWINRQGRLTVALMQIDAARGAQQGGAGGDYGAALLSGAEKGGASGAEAGV
jgi:hypothetical protein